MSEQILIRHGLSQYNKENLFTGWLDIPLSEKGYKTSTGCCFKIENIKLIRFIYQHSCAHNRPCKLF